MKTERVEFLRVGACCNHDDILLAIRVMRRAGRVIEVKTEGNRVVFMARVPKSVAAQFKIVTTPSTGL